MRIGSLFSGIGGLELGLEWAGLGHVVWQVEQDEFCRSVLAKHWPDAERFDDVRTVGAHCLAPVDLICGGFPCQDLSYAGKGAGLAGARSGLWSEYRRIVGELRPRFVVVENVAALLARGLGDVLGDLAALGYDAEWHCLRASDVGAPHRRDRLFIVAYTERVRELQPKGREPDEWRWVGDSGQDVAYANAGGRRERSRAFTDETGEPEPENGGQGMADSHESRLERWREPIAGSANEWASREGGPQRPNNDGPRGAESRLGREPHGLPARVDRWPAPPHEAQHEWEAPRVCAPGPNRSARLKAQGNAVVPQVAERVGWLVKDIAKRHGIAA